MNKDLLNQIKKIIINSDHLDLNDILVKINKKNDEEQKLILFSIISSMIYFEIKNPKFQKILPEFLNIKLSPKNGKIIENEKMTLIIGLMEKKGLWCEKAEKELLDIFLDWYQNRYNIMINYFDYLMEKENMKIIKLIYSNPKLKLENKKIMLEIFFNKKISKKRLKFSLKLIKENLKMNKFKLQSLSLFEYNILKILKIGLTSFEEQIQKMVLEIIDQSQIFFNQEIFSLMLEKEKFVKFPEMLNKEDKIIQVLRGILIYTLESDNPMIRIDTLKLIEKKLLENDKIKIEFFREINKLIIDFFNDEDVLVRLFVLQMDNMMKQKLIDNDLSVFELFDENLKYYDYLLSEDEKNIRFEIYSILNKFRFEKNISEKLFIQIINVFQKNFGVEKIKKFENDFILENLFLMLDRNKIYSQNLWALYQKEFEEVIFQKQEKKSKIFYLTSFYFFSKTYERNKYFLEDKFLSSRNSFFLSSKYLKLQNSSNENSISEISAFFKGQISFQDFLKKFQNCPNSIFKICFTFLQNFDLTSPSNFPFFVYTSLFFNKFNILNFLVYLKKEIDLDSKKQKNSLFSFFILTLFFHRKHNNFDLKDLAFFSISLNDYLKPNFFNEIDHLDNFQNKLTEFYKDIIEININQIHIVSNFIFLFSENKKKIFIPHVSLSLKFFSRNCQINDFSNLFIFSNDEFFDIIFVKKKSFLIFEINLVFFNNDNRCQKFQLVRKINEQFFYPLSNECLLEFLHKYITY